MRFWIDAQLPPQLARWLSDEFGVAANSLRDIGLRDALDAEIFEKARAAKVVLVSKDSDFVEMVSRHGPPPQLLWVTCGNVTNARLQQAFRKTFADALTLLREGQAIVELA